MKSLKKMVTEMERLTLLVPIWNVFDIPISDMFALVVARCWLFLRVRDFETQHAQLGM